MPSREILDRGCTIDPSQIPETLKRNKSPEPEPMPDPTEKNTTPRPRPRPEQIGHIHIHKNGMVTVADPLGNDLPQFGGPSEEVLPLLLAAYGGPLSYDE